MIFSDLNGNGIIKKEEIIQETHYYPFGGKLNGLNTVQIGPQNQFKFNGNELHSDNRFNWYNFNARFYMPELGRFTSVDPLTERSNQISLSPYQFSWNNPIALNDPTGLSPDDDDYGFGNGDGGQGEQDGKDRRRRTPQRDYSLGCIECVQEEVEREYLDFERELIDIGREESIDLNSTFEGANGFDNGEISQQNNEGLNISNKLPVAKAFSLDLDINTGVGINSSNGYFLILQGPDAGEVVPFTDLGFGVGWDISGNLKETNIFFSGNIDNLTKEAFGGSRLDFSIGFNVFGVDFSVSFFRSRDAINGGRLYGVAAGFGIGLIPSPITGNSNTGVTVIK